MFKANKWLVVMVWLTALVVYGVFEIDRAIRATIGVQNVQFSDTPVPVTVNDPALDNVSVIPMGGNTVWILNRANMEVTVITRDRDGQFHMEGPMSILTH
ncbi:hypothetical protein [Alicyclobacillus mali (ex Roth et al. 2021)]|uniref:hypothetical protein n=1 Tax=Alicyclobacillus mali (ex Roth et al. 2021) TaxID=1123961 RepID=UPI001A8F8590|nr:hypothetical protein [Alicyclobacillus mali (ex Roth et al. 2021)]